MGILTKNKKVAEVEYAPLEGITYVEFASQELNSEVNKLIVTKNRIKSLLNAMIADMKENGETHILIKRFHELLEKEKTNDKEIEATKRKYQVDFELSVLAQEIDKADRENHSIDLIHSIVPSINEVLDKLPEISACYGAEINTPYPVLAIKKVMERLPTTLNAELPKLIKVDKTPLIRKFNERLAVVERNRSEAQAMKDKYIL